MNDEPGKTNKAADALEALLRESHGHVPDEGFTARVMTNLPRRPPAGTLRNRILLGGLAAGVVVVLAQAPTVGAVLASFREHAQRGELSSLLPLLPVLVSVGALLWAWVSFGCEEA